MGVSSVGKMAEREWLIHHQFQKWNVRLLAVVQRMSSLRDIRESRRHEQEQQAEFLVLPTMSAHLQAARPRVTRGLINPVRLAELGLELANQ